MRKLFSKTLYTLVSKLPLQEKKDPVFIVGCGRSGTTILGKSLSQHPQITYLNEPRCLWSSCYPETDIWSNHVQKHSGKLSFSESDLEQIGTTRLRKLFWFETIKTGRPVLIEKLPINNFRLEFIKGMFPKSKFVYIKRNAIDVAKSIERLCNEGGWFSKNPHKWTLLRKYASLNQETKELPNLCQNYYEKGLLEWRLSTDAIDNFFKEQPKEYVYTISYEDFIENPQKSINKLLLFLDLKTSSRLDSFVSSNVKKRSSSVPINYSDKERAILGI